MSSTELFRSATTLYQSRMLAVAVELDLLATDGATLGELCDRLGLHPQPTEALLNDLCALGLLDYRAGRYHNGELANGVQRTDVRHPLWTRLRALLETDELGSEQSILECVEDESGSLRDFAEAVDAHSAGCGPALAAAIDWTSHHTVVDLGGARGTVLAGILAAHRHLRGVSFDLPAMEPLFAEHAHPGVTGRIRFQAGDFFTDDLPPADAYLLGHLLPDWDDERSESLIARAAAALPPGGKLLIYDAMLDPDSPQDARNWVRTLNTQLCTPGGSANTAADCRKWMERAGLTGVQVQPLATAVSPAETLVVASKPR